MSVAGNQTKQHYLAEKHFPAKQYVAALGQHILAHWQMYVIVLVIYNHVLRAVGTVCPFDEKLYDGPFQLYNCLRRMDAGQAPGRDFDVFHGFFIPILHYPLYKLFGGGLFASEVARQFVSRFLTLAVYILFSKWSTGKLTLAAIWSLATLLPSFDLNENPTFVAAVIESFNNNIVTMAIPANSLYGLRCLFPLLFIGLLFLEKGRLVNVSRVLVLVLSFFMSVEHGVALLATVFGTSLIVLALSIFRRELREPALYLFKLIVAAIIVIGVCLTIYLRPENLGKYLTYHFVSQINDQMWYFGAPPNLYLLDGIPKTNSIALLLLIVVGLTAIYLLASYSRLYRHKAPLFYTAENDVQTLQLNAKSQTSGQGASTSEYQEGLSLAFIIGMTYGLMSCASLLGYALRQNFGCYTRIAEFLATVLILRSLQTRPRFRNLQATAVCLMLVFVSYRTVRDTYVYGSKIREGSGYVGAIRKHIDTLLPLLKLPQENYPRNYLWSFYSGPLEDEMKIFHPTQYDYIIHALGDEREKYNADFLQLQPLYVQTMRNDKFSYEEWLRTSNFTIYNELLTNYQIVATSSYAHLWKRKPPVDTVGALPERWQTLQADPATGDYVIPADLYRERNSLVMVRVEYEVQNPIAKIPVIGKCARYLVNIDGAKSRLPVSLSPYKNRHVFPIMPANQPLKIDFSVNGLRLNAELDVQRVEVKSSQISEENKEFLLTKPFEK